MFTWVANFVKDERGQGMTEYGLIIALVAVLLIGSLVALKDTLLNIFEGVETDLNNGINGTT